MLFRKGDVADHLYMLASGRVELVEIGTELPAGRVFGEIAFFAPDGRRTLSARCIDHCEVLAIDESTVRQLYFQNPEFGFEVIGLVASRFRSRRCQRRVRPNRGSQDLDSRRSTGSWRQTRRTTRTDPIRNHQQSA